MKKFRSPKVLAYTIAVLLGLVAVATVAQTYTPMSVQAYLWNAGTSAWQAAVGSGTPVTGIYPPMAVGLYCVDGSGNWVKATTTGNCFSGGGSGTINSGTTGQIAYYAANGTTLSGTGALPNGTTATTQSASDNSTKVATTQYVDSAVGALVPFVFKSTLTVVGSSTSALTFSSIPQTATDLELTCTGSLLSAVDIANQNMTVNNDTASHYNYSVTTNFAGVVGGAGTGGALVGAALLSPFNGTSTTGTSTVNILIPQYRNTTPAYKTFEYKGGTRRTSDAFFYDGFAYWNSNAAITRIDITDSGGGNYAAGTTCTLRGLP